jgi:ABC-2 type transport system permease protein
MRRVLAVALREYKAAVQTKAFILSLVLMPILFAISVGVQMVVNTADTHKTKTHAVVDRTRQLRAALETAKQRHNEFEIYNVVTKAREAPAYELVFVEPSVDSQEAIQKQRLELSQRHASGEFEGFLEIGPDVFEIVPPGSPPDDRHDIRFQSDKIAERDFSRWAARALNDAVQAHRFERRQISAEVVHSLQTPVPVRVKAATKVNPVTGAIEDASDESRVASFFLPGVLVMLMFMMVLLGAVPAMQGVVEEKQQRIAEVLLGCVPPFQLMLGKLVGVVAVSFTVGSVYLGGGYAVASRYGMTSLVAPSLIAWFVVFMVLSSLIYGSLFMAVGAAASDMKETQSLQMPIMMIVTLPLLLLGAVLRDPNGPVALVGSFVPFSAPMLMTARLATPSGVPWWQPVVAATGVLAMALACVWAAGRVFRLGLLMQGKGVRFSDLARWIVRG